MNTKNSRKELIISISIIILIITSFIGSVIPPTNSKRLYFHRMAAGSLDVEFDSLMFKVFEGEIFKYKGVITLSVSGIKGKQTFTIIDTIPVYDNTDGYLSISNDGKTSKIIFIGDTLCFISYEEDERIFIFSTK